MAKRSIKVRVTVSTLAIFVLSIWMLSFFGSRVLQTEMQRVLGEAQFSTALFMAAAVNGEVQERLDALEDVAAIIPPFLLDTPAAVEQLLNERPALQIQFNAGLYIAGTDGTAVASFPISLERAGVNFMDRDYIVATLQEGRSAIGKPVIGKLVHAPIIGMATPIRDAQGQVIGALAGVTDLSQSNFLDKISISPYGKGGSYLLEDAKSRLVITGTDKRRIMQPLTAPGIDKLIDRHVRGVEETSIAVNPQGVEVLISTKRIPVAGWFVEVALPTDEAFAPIRTMQQRMRWITILLTLLAGGVTWWTLRRQLAPLQTAAQTLATRSDSRQSMQPLPITSQDEIGELIASFNRLLTSLGQQEEALRKSEEQYRALADNLPSGMVVHGPDTRILFANAAAADLLGLSMDQMLGKTAMDPYWRFLREDGSPMPFEDYPINRVYASGAGFQNQVVGVCRQDCAEPVWMLANAYVEKDEQGQIMQAVVTFTDLTDRKRAERALRNSVALLNKSQEIARLGSWELDLSSNRLIWSDEVYRLFGLQPQIIVASYESFLDAIHPDDRALVDAAYRDSLQEGCNGYQIEHRVIRQKTGEVRIVQEKCEHWRDSAGKVIRSVGMVQDITDRKRTEEELLEINRSLERAVERANTLAVLAETANRAKSGFLANISHEIRTPMNAIIGFAELLAADIPNDRQRHQATIIANSGKTLLRLINDLLDLSKIEAGKVDIQPELFSPAHLLNELQLFFALRAREKGLTLVFTAAPDLPGSAMLDPTRLRQILSNLIGNAIKFTDSGQVTVTAETMHENETVAAGGIQNIDPNSCSLLRDLRFKVTDTGLGIPDYFKPRLFGAFEQLPGQDHSKYGGTGLGLAISRRLAQLMNGTLEVADNPAGHGSVFTLTLREVQVFASPAFVKLDAHPFAARIEFSQTPAILVVDDVATNRELIKSYLLPYGFSILEAGDGCDALEMVQEQRPALVLTDLKMPIMDGRELARRIRAEAGSMRIIALTAAATETDADNSDFDGFLSKPVSQSELLREIARFIPHTIATPAPAPVTHLPAPVFPLPPELVAEIAAVRKTLCIPHVKALAEKLRALPELTRLAADLQSAANSFQIDKIQTLLNGLLPASDGT